MRTETFEALAGAANKVTIGGAATSVTGFITASDIASITGALVAVAGFAVMWYYKRRADQRREADFQLKQKERWARIDLMQRTGRPVDDPSDLAEDDV